MAAMLNAKDISARSRDAMSAALCRLACLLLFLCPATTLQAEQEGAVKRPDFTKETSWFPRFYKLYQARPVPESELRNSASVTQLIRDGKLRLSLVQLNAAVKENNLDIVSAGYSSSYAETDLLRARGGGAARGAPGVQIPSGLFTGALGAGVGDAAGLGGFGSAGGISGGARAVTVRPRGSFDPALIMNFSMDRTTSPLNTIRVSGVPIVSTATTALQARYAQQFTTGTSVSVTFNNQRQSSTQQSLLYNPAFVSSFSLNFTQQILNGAGRAVNRRFMEVAKNGLQIARESYRQQVIITLAQAQSLYWDLVAARDNLRDAANSLEVARQLYQDNKAREEIGVLAGIDVVTAESEVAARQRDLVVAQANLQLREVELKSVLSKEIDSALGSAAIEATDSLPEPKDPDIPKLSDALATALRSRPELRQAEGNILIQAVAVKYAKNILKPTLTLFGVFSSAGLFGDRFKADSSPRIIPGGIWQALNQVILARHPEYAIGFTFSVPLLNRSAQADNLRARLEQRQAETALEGTRSDIALEVRKAVIGLVQAKSQVESARKAAALSQQILSAEQEKLLAGLSTAYDVIRRQRDLLVAQVAEVQARANYAKALVEMNRSMGVLDIK
jgi:outer membrane protein